MQRASYAAAPAEAQRVNYYEHLKSDYWRAIRNVALKVAGHTCSCCESRDQLEVHHKGYTNLGNETLEDVTVLCHVCHERHHYPGEGIREVEVIKEVTVIDGPDTMTHRDRMLMDRIWSEA